jgi:central kinetochore subunit Mis15/CHL4
LRLKATDPVPLKTLNRLSRASLISIALAWLDEEDESLSAPCLVTGSDADVELDETYPLASSVEEVRQTYRGLEERKGSKREVVDRIVEGDWRHGLSLFQLAMADMQYLFDHPTSQKWSAYRIAALKTPTTSAEAEEPPRLDKESLVIPRFHPSAFLQQLQAQVLPDIKAHYQFASHNTLPLMILRIFILDSPYNTDLAATNHGGDRLSVGSEASRTVYIAFPNSAPYVYLSTPPAVGQTTTGEFKSLRNLIIEGIPKALSRPRARYTLESTNLATRNLSELLERRGPGNTNAAAGGWSLYVDPKKMQSPLNTVLPIPPPSDGDVGTNGLSRTTDPARKRPVSPATDTQERAMKRFKWVAQSRFGSTANLDDGKGVERVDIVMEDAFSPKGESQEGGDEPDRMAADHERRDRPRRTRAGRQSRLEEILVREREDDEGKDEDSSHLGSWRPKVRLTFHGPHVFAGVRKLVENGILDGEKMPGWLTGEEGVTIGAVRHGRIRGRKGSGM